MFDVRVLKMTITIRMIICGKMNTTWKTLSSVIWYCHKELKIPINGSRTRYRSLQGVNNDVTVLLAGNSQ
jgi:hypothetical protein